MKTSEKISEWAKAMVSASAEISNVNPNRTGYGYKYADLASIIDAAKPALLKNGLIAIQTVGESEKSIRITTRIQHISGEFIEDSFDLPETGLAKANNVQMMGASITYGRRYGLACMLGIAVEEDTDGKFERKPPPAAKQYAPAQANNGKISDAQRRLIFAKCKEYSVEPDWVKAFVKNAHGCEVADMPSGAVNAILAAMKQQGGK